MCKANLVQLVQYVKGHTGEYRIEDLRAEFNNNLPSTRKLTTREFAFALRVLKKKGFNIKHDSALYVLGSSQPQLVSRIENPLLAPL